MDGCGDWKKAVRANGVMPELFATDANDGAWPLGLPATPGSTAWHAAQIIAA
jgi:hypothetical protein